MVDWGALIGLKGKSGAYIWLWPSHWATRRRFSHEKKKEIFYWCAYMEATGHMWNTDPNHRQFLLRKVFCLSVVIVLSHLLVLSFLLCCVSSRKKLSKVLDFYWVFKKKHSAELSLYKVNKFHCDNTVPPVSSEKPASGRSSFLLSIYTVEPAQAQPG